MENRVLILSGPTHEYIDPVRFIGNASSGLMGKAIAKEAVIRGFRVDFVTGPVPKNNLPNLGDLCQIYPVISASEMLEKARALYSGAAVAVFAAAVADYAPAEKKTEKMPKSTDELTLKLCPTPDIAKIMGGQKIPGQINLGFALQTENGEANARRKLASKNLDGIVLNTPASLGALTGTFSFLSVKSAAFENWGCIDKAQCARNIFDRIESMKVEQASRLL